MPSCFFLKAVIPPQQNVVSRDVGVPRVNELYLALEKLLFMLGWDFLVIQLFGGQSQSYEKPFAHLSASNYNKHIVSISVTFMTSLLLSVFDGLSRMSWHSLTTPQKILSWYNNPKCPSMGEYMQKLCFIYILFAYSDIIEKKLSFTYKLVFVTFYFLKLTLLTYNEMNSSQKSYWESPPACKQEKYLPPGCATIPATNWKLFHQGPLWQPTPCIWTSSP